MRIIGLDIHRAFAEAVAWKDGRLSRLGRVIMRREALEEFAKQLSNSDIVVIEATGNAASVAAVLAPHVSRVVIANPKQVRLIAHAKIKTDKIDAGVLAQLYASGFLPEVWIADETTQALRRQVTRRNQIVRQRSRLKNIMQSILHAHLIPSCPHQDLVGKGKVYRGAAGSGRTPEYDAFIRNRSYQRDDGSLTGRTPLERQIVHIADSPSRSPLAPQRSCGPLPTSR
jgi:transposase